MCSDNGSLNEHQQLKFSFYYWPHKGQAKLIIVPTRMYF